MSAFVAALAVLHTDPNLSEAGEWRAAAGGVWRSLRWVRSAPSDDIGGLGGSGARSQQIVLVVRAEDFDGEPPKRGTLLRASASAPLWRVEAAERDALGLSFTLTVSTTA
jgi:hypothetical protein